MRGISRKQTLQHRVAAMSRSAPLAPVTGAAASPAGTPMVMPLAAVFVSYPVGGYSTLGYRMLQPLFTPDGAAIPATAPGTWGQLRQAGRP